ncbi:hypothetical protein PIB30_079117 [Stylosanthes scabra]|uniref:RNase H type-1 domain-containing protein n=1 Tax=Stylosanthes scabra TaxID=79078 RepID=A0ABU6QTH7_9FABA|nr:hypothetical protein [Stylosanthes scabra]
MNASTSFVGGSKRYFPYNENHKLWNPPPINVVKLNCDASLMIDRNMAEFGCILRDSSGTFLKACTGISQPNRPRTNPPQI